MSIDAVLIRVADPEGLTFERWCRRVLHPWNADADGQPHVYAYADLLSGCHYPPQRCTELRDGRVEVRAVEVA